MKRYTLIYCLKEGTFGERFGYEMYETLGTARHSLKEYENMFNNECSDGFVYIIDNSTKDIICWIT